MATGNLSLEKCNGFQIQASGRRRLRKEKEDRTTNLNIKREFKTKNRSTTKRRKNVK